MSRISWGNYIILQPKWKIVKNGGLKIKNVLISTLRVKQVDDPVLKKEELRESVPNWFEQVSSDSNNEEEPSS